MSAPLTAPAEAYDPEQGRYGPDSPDVTPAWIAHIIARIIFFLLQHKLLACRRRGSAWMHGRPRRQPSSGAPGPTQPRPPSRRNPLGDAIDQMLRQRGMGMGPGPGESPEQSQGNGSGGGCVRHPAAGAPPGGALPAPPGSPPAPPGPPPWWQHPAIMEFMLAVVDATLPPAAPPAQEGLAGAPAPDTAPAPDAAPPWTEHVLSAALRRQVVTRAGIGPIRAGAGPPIRAGTGPPIGARAGPFMVRACQICNA